MIGRREEQRLIGITVVIVLLGGQAQAGRADPGNTLDTPIIFTQLPIRPELEQRPGRCGGTLRQDYGEGGRIVRLDPGGRPRVLTQDFDSACGADVSFDGERLLFAAKKQPQDTWNIWEMRADGSDVRQVTNNVGNCRSPAYQATLYTIVSTEPWYQIMFVSDAAGEMNEYGCGPATSLYSCKLDGSGVRRLTMNLSDDLAPFLMDDGRVLLASWQRMDLRRGFDGRVSLFGVNTDGADYALYCGGQGQRVKHMPCQTTDGLVVFVEADRVDWDGAGQLASVTLRRHFYSHHQITTDKQYRYHSPSPLRDGAVLVSCRPTDGSATHGIYRLDPRSGKAELVFNDPNYHDVHARALVARPRPDGRSSVVNEKYPTGRFYCLNAYLIRQARSPDATVRPGQSPGATGPAAQPHMKPGMIRRLRVIEGVPVAADNRAAYLPPGTASGISGPGTSRHGIAPLVQKRLLGVVPVEEDGSFNIELPADVPVQLQTLDENGMALRACGWIWVKHREPRGCIGCHEDPELTPENRFVQAVQRPSMKLTLLAEKRRTVDFRRDLMPIIAAKCTACHTGGEASLDLRAERTDHFNRAYHSLLARTNQATPIGKPLLGKYVHPGQARTSPLIWRLYGRNTSRPWDPDYNVDQTFPVCPPAGFEPLTAEEKLVFIEWIDLGAPWDGIPGLDGFSAIAEKDNSSEGVK
ncbi:MAG: hypothetical protein KAY37_02585 [Phycisphaerae bacterium]|nr:hypothetical protein [Phycisphaerae bacterium]